MMLALPPVRSLKRSQPCWLSVDCYFEGVMLCLSSDAPERTAPTGSCSLEPRELLGEVRPLLDRNSGHLV